MVDNSGWTDFMGVLEWATENAESAIGWDVLEAQRIQAFDQARVSKEQEQQIMDIVDEQSMMVLHEMYKILTSRITLK